MKFCALILSLLLITAPAYTAFAHGEEPRIELNVTQASPGATIDLRGSGFEPGDTTTIMLMNAEGQMLLGSATIDDHGDLTYAILLPMDLANGAYEVRVADTHHEVAAPLDIVPDSNGDEEGGQRGEDEPLLAPMPAQVNPTGHTTPALSVDTTPSRPTTKIEPPIPIALLFASALAIVILVAGLFAFSRRSR